MIVVKLAEECQGGFAVCRRLADFEREVLHVGGVVDHVLDAVFRRDVGEILLRGVDILGTGVDELGRTCRVDVQILIVEERQEHQTEVVLGVAGGVLLIGHDGLDGAGLEEAHGIFAGCQIAFRIHKFIAQVVVAEIALLCEVVELLEGSDHIFVLGKGRLVGVELVDDARLELVKHLAVLAPEHGLMPAVCHRLIDRGDAGIEDLLAHVFKLGKRRGNCLHACCGKDLLVVDHVVVGGGVEVGHAVDDAVHRGLLLGKNAVAVKPGLSFERNGVVLHLVGSCNCEA